MTATSAASSRVALGILVCLGATAGTVAWRHQANQAQSLAQRIEEMQLRLAGMAEQPSRETMREAAREEATSATEAAVAREQQLTSGLAQRIARNEHAEQTLADRAAAIEARLQEATVPDDLRDQLSRCEQGLAAITRRLDDLAIPDERRVLDQATEAARNATSAALAQVKQELETLRTQLPNRDQLTAELVRELAHKDREATLSQARQLLQLPSDSMQTIGLAQLFALDAVAFLQDLRGYLAAVDPDRSPETMRLSLTLLAQSQDSRFHMLLLEAASGSLNSKLVPQALVALSTIDLTAGTPEMARLALAGVLQPPLIDDPNRFNTIIDVVRAAVGSAPSNAKLALDAASDQRASLGEMFLRFFRNYLGSRLLNIDASGTTFPITNVDSLGSSSVPQLSASNRERALYLCKVARAFGLERDAGRFLVALVSKTGAARGTGDEQPRTFLIKLLEELSGQRHGEDWSRWQAWVKG